MFHNTTTIWHNPYPQQSPFKERRMAYGILSTLKGAATSLVSGVFKAGHYTKRAAMSWPARGLARPITWALGKTWDGAKWTYEKATWGMYYGKELGTGVVGKANSFGRSLFELGMVPVNFVKHNIVGQTRSVIGDLLTLKTPKSIINIPKNAWLGLKEGITATRKKISATVKSVSELKVFQTLKNTRDAILNTLSIPLRPIYKPTREVLDTPLEMGGNIGKSIMSVPEGIVGSLTHLRGMISRVLGAHDTASGHMAERKMRGRMAVAALESAH